MSGQEQRVWDPGRSEAFLVRLRIGLARRGILSLAARTGGECIVDVGCGKSATFLQSMGGVFTRRVGVDLELDDAALTAKGIEPRKGDALAALSSLESDSADVITFLSFMEHVTTQEAILAQCRRVLRKNGVVFINSPSWFGKFILENIVLRFLDKNGMYSAQVDTHTTYFSCAQMWQTIRNSGFVSSEIKVWRSNFLCSVSACITKKHE